MTATTAKFVKITPYRPGLGSIFYRQTPDGCRRAADGLPTTSFLSRDGRYCFYMGDTDVENPDFWVVQSKGLRTAQTCRVARENTILLTTEPHSVLVYPDRYTHQFGVVCTSQEQLHHPHRMLMQPVLPWFVGFERISNGYRITQDYASLHTSATPAKTKLLSVITSDKAFTRGHVDRIRFVRKLQDHYGDRIDIFGKGYRDFNDKWDVVAPYKYQIVIENSAEPHYWTEKLGDCFLAETFPFYHGGRCAMTDFPANALQPIDIHDADAAIATIDAAIAAHRYEQAKDDLHEAQRLMLDRYNMFDTIAAICDTLNPDAPKDEVTLQPCRSTDAWCNTWRYAVVRNYYKWSLKLMGGGLKK